MRSSAPRKPADISSTPLKSQKTRKMRDLHESTESHHFSKLEVIFCAFQAENKFVNALILFIRVRRNAGIMDDIGKTHQLQLESGCFETRLTKKYARRKPYEKHDPRIITAFLPGSIAEVDARVGMRVRQGDTLLILEAMKMRNK